MKKPTLDPELTKVANEYLKHHESNQYIDMDIPQAVVPCKGCKTKWIASPAGPFYCPKCGLNYYWLGADSEKFTGPQFKK